MPKNSLEEILRKVLGIGERAVTDDMAPENVDSWDSFNGLMLVTELEKNWNVSFTLDEVTSVKNVGDIKKVLRGRGIEV